MRRRTILRLLPIAVLALTSFTAASLPATASAAISDSYKGSVVMQVRGCTAGAGCYVNGYKTQTGWWVLWRQYAGKLYVLPVDSSGARWTYSTKNGWVWLKGYSNAEYTAIF